MVHTDANLALIIFVLIIHYMADFGLQTHDQATQKSSSNKWLFYHVGVYTLIWFLSSYLLFLNWTAALCFSIITFICHFITDYITSRVGKPFWEKKDFHNGFSVVGFDQVLHYVQLFVTYQFLASYFLK